VLSQPLDEGSEHFPPTTLQITSIDVGNTASNVIPGAAQAVFDCRSSDRQTSASVIQWLREHLDSGGVRYELRVRISGESFLTPPGPFVDLIASAVQSSIGITPALGTTGGTSDARFIKDYCPVAELGLLHQTAHKTDERASLSDLSKLSAIYEAVLDGYFHG
jgi:succinyl-diaminopimelate desuccinylase